MIGWGTKWAARPRVTLFELVVFFVAHLANVIGKGGHWAPAPAPTPVETVAPNKSEQATDEQEKQRQSEQEKRQ